MPESNPNTQEPQNGPQEPQNAPQTGQEAPDPVDSTEDVSALRSEAARRRRSLRAAEAERDQLRTRIDDRDRQDVEQMAAERFADPRDVWAVTSLDDLRGDDGAINMQRVEAEFSRIAKDRPHWAKQEPKPPLDLHPGARQTPPRPPSFGESLRKAMRRG